MKIKNIMLLIVFILPIATASDYYTTETKNNYEITWELQEDHSNYKEYLVTIKNYENNSRDIDLSILLDFDVDADIKIYEWKEILTSVYEPVNICSDINDNGTLENYCRDKLEPIQRMKATWKETIGNKRKLASSLFKDYGLINIPKTDSKIKTDYYNIKITVNGEKYFKVIITGIQPILYNGVLGIIDFNSGSLYHPIINSSFYSANFLIDNATSADITKTATLLNSVSPLNSNVVSSWTLDDIYTSLPTAIDNAGTQNGTINGADTGETGIINEAYRFVAANTDSVDITHNAAYLIPEISIGFWMKPNETGNQKYVVVKEAAGNNDGDYGMTIGVDNKISASMQDGGGSDTITSNSIISANTWHYILFSHKDGNHSVYINGTYENSIAFSWTIEANTNTLQLGQYLVDTIPFNGWIDEVVWYDTFLNKSQALELYNNEIGIQYPYIDTDVYQSLTFNTGDTHNELTPNFICTGECIINITAEDELFFNVTNGATLTLATPPLDNTTFNYTVQLGNGSQLQYLNITFVVAITTPLFSNIKYYTLDSNQTVIGNETTYNLTNIQDIEFLMINFTIENFQENFSLYYTMNGTEACALGNKQNDDCINYPSYVKFLNNSITTYFDGTQGTQGDFITCNFVGTTNRNYSCIIDEHYQNVFKWYNADYNFSDVKFQDGNNQRISSNGVRIIKAVLDPTNIPLDAPFYKLDFRALPVGTPDALNAYLCNSTYTTGNPLTNDNCELVGSREANDFQDDGTKYREIFSKDFINGLGDIKFVILQSFTAGINNYYALKTIASNNITWNTHWEYSTNTGTTWTNLADGYETEVNINWYYNDTAFIARLNTNNTNSTDNVLEWIEAVKDFEPIIIITNPPEGFDTNITTINVSWIAMDAEGDVNVSVYLDETLNQTNFNNSDSTLINNVSAGIHSITVEGCDNTNQCVNDTNNFTITVFVDPLSEFSCLKLGECIDGKNKCLLVIRNNDSEVIDTEAFDENCKSLNSENFGFIFLLFGIATIFFTGGVIKRIPLLMILGSGIGILGSLTILNRWIEIGFYLLIIFITMELFSVIYLLTRD